jgi:hypothetical protein
LYSKNLGIIRGNKTRLKEIKLTVTNKAGIYESL